MNCRWWSVTLYHNNYYLNLALPKFSSEPRFEPWTSELDREFWFSLVQVHRFVNRFSSRFCTLCSPENWVRTGSNREPDFEDNVIKTLNSKMRMSCGKYRLWSRCKYGETKWCKNSKWSKDKRLKTQLTVQMKKKIGHSADINHNNKYDWRCRNFSNSLTKYHVDLQSRWPQQLCSRCSREPDGCQ